ncbi:MAG: hypothetical protein DMD85_02530 [Candidatus Rokuibacteriota bacterium]|nr:MAG: hypothetical protein DMD85_02530 [Candidatus Rokubacteria bacterium]
MTLSAAGLWRYAVATGAMLVVVSLARPLGVAVAITLAAATYAAALWALGYTRSSDHLVVKRLLVEQPQAGWR